MSQVPGWCPCRSGSRIGSCPTCDSAKLRKPHLRAEARAKAERERVEQARVEEASLGSVAAERNRQRRLGGR